DIEDPPELDWQNTEPSPAQTETAEPEFDTPGSWVDLPEGVTRLCVRCGHPTSSVVGGRPRHVYLQAMAAMGMPRCGTRPTAGSAPASVPQADAASAAVTPASAAPAAASAA